MISILPAPPQVPGLEFRILAAVAFTAVAAYFDAFNRKWVPNCLVYGFAAAAVLSNIIFFDPIASVHALAFGVAVFLITYPLYRIGQLGGADVFAFASIAATVPYFQSPLLAPHQAVQYPFILSVLVPTSLLFIFHMLARFIPHVFSLLREGKLKISAGKAAGPALLLVSFAFFMYAVSTQQLPLPPAYMALVSALFLSLVFFSLFKGEIKESMVEGVPPSRLMEEDVLALENMDAGLVKKLGLKPLLDAKEIALLKKARLRSVPVYTGMPCFLPYLLLGLLFTLLFGDLLSRMIPF